MNIAEVATPPSLPTDSRLYYAEMPEAPEYARMVDARYYADLPEDWTIVMTDVKGSTRAIEEGRYKDVNMIGVSTIVAVQNALADRRFPYVFGGDGATLAIPSADVAVARNALSLVRRVAADQFGMNLRVALIPVTTLRAAGGVLSCAKLRISTTQTLALVRGTGWAMAEEWMKTREADFGLPAEDLGHGEFTGLECRWNPLPAKKDEVIALIVQARVTGARAEEIFRDILTQILDPEFQPIRMDTIKLRWPPQYLYAEAKVRVRGMFTRVFYYLAMSAKVLLQVAYVAWRERPAGRAQPITYLRELTENTDYVKFDESLRMVIDVSTEQKIRLLANLEAYARAGEIDYGYHADRNALMTCYIEGPDKHIHFVDAAGGGYALAAKRLKESKRARA